MADPKLHHWWPQFHQKHWTDGKGHVHRIAIGKTFPITPKSNAAITDDNTLVLDNTKNRDVEKWFATQIEGPAAAALASFTKYKNLTQVQLPAPPQAASRIGGVINGMSRIRQLNISAAERLALGRYIASLIVRVPSYRYQISGVLESLRQRAETERGIKIPAPSFTENRNSQILWMTEHLEDFSHVIANSFWMGFEAPMDVSFLFSDTPVIPYREADDRLSFVLPLFPKLALCIMQHPQGSPVNTILPIVQSGEVLVNDYNEKSVSQARAMVFADAAPSPAVIDLVNHKISSFQPEIAGPPEFGVRRWLDGL